MIYRFIGATPVQRDRHNHRRLNAQRWAATGYRLKNKPIQSKHKSDTPMPCHQTLMQPAERSGPLDSHDDCCHICLLYRTFVCLSKQNTLPNYTANLYLECRVVDVYSFSFWSQFGAAGNNTAHLILPAKLFPPTVSQNNRLKVYLPLELRISYLCRADRERVKTQSKTEQHGDKL